MVYEPREDSQLMAKHLSQLIKKEKPKLFLDMGCGSGIQSKVAIDSGVKKDNIWATDIEEDALIETKKLGVNVRKSDLFQNVNDKFDLIAFNPPYLPATNHDKVRDTTGGKYGWETIARFLREAKKYLTGKGKILLLFSSITQRQKMDNLIQKAGYKAEELAQQRVFMENLYLVLLSK